MKEKHHFICFALKKEDKLLKIMKIHVLVTFLCVFSAVAENSYSQSQISSFEFTDITLKKAFDEIEKNSDYLFLVADDAVSELNRRVNINSENRTINEILDRLLQDTDLSYKIVNRQIAVRKNIVSTVSLANKGAKKEFFQQAKKQITGKVVDAQGEVLIGANVIERETNNGTITDANGRFSMYVAEKATIVVSYVGFLTREINIQGQTNLNIILKEDSKVLKDVVLIGYGAQSRITVTGSISTVSAQEIDLIRTPTIAEGILGKISGLSMTQIAGTPGESDPRIFIRGIGTFNDTDPLIIIDGVPNSMRAFMQLNPSSIESISLLKDASATSVYGVQGANGVILVNTKRGQIGKISIDASASYGVQVPTKLLEFANSYQYALAYNDMLRSDEKTTGFIPEEHIEHYKNQDQPLLFPSHNWVKEVLGNSAPQSRVNLNISGGNESIRYFTSIGYFNQKGLITQSGPDMANFGYNRINLQTNVDVNITSTTKLAFTSSSRIGSRIEPIPGGTVNMSTVWNQLYNMPPLSSVGEVNGKFIIPDKRYLPQSLSFVEESFTQYLYKGNYRNDEENRFDFNIDFTQNLKAITEVLDGLKFRTKISYRSGFDRNKAIEGGRNETYISLYNKDAAIPNPDLGEYDIVLKKNGDIRNRVWRTWYTPKRYIYFEVGFDYEKTFGKHYVSSLLLYNQNKDYFVPSSWAYNYIPSGNVGLVGRVNYNYNQQYMAEINLGYNGSENFARYRRFGLFPSISLAWVVSKETFMKNISFIDHLKFRFSYGKVGSDQAGGMSRFTYLQTIYDRDVLQYYGYNFGDDIPQFRPGVLEGTVGNADVTWETAKKQNYGIDLEFLRNRLKLSVDYYHEYRNDILMLPNSIPAFIGFEMPMLNIGIIKNHGLDFVFGWHDRARDFSYALDANFSYAKNTIIFTDEIPPVEAYQSKTGHPLNSFYGYVWEGFYTQSEADKINEEKAAGVNPKDRTYPIPVGIATVRAGDMKYVDLNKDGTIDAIDQRVIGYPDYPQITMGLNANFSYRQFDLNFGLQGAAQVSRMLAYTEPFGSNDRASLWLPLYESSWTPERYTAGTVKFPRISLDNKKYNSMNSSFWVRDASYLRLKRVELGYTINNLPLAKKMRIYLAGSNLLTLQKEEYKWNDPEIRRNTYPLIKQYSFGVNVTF